LLYGLDNGDEMTKINPKFLDINNFEKYVCLGLLGESAPVIEFSAIRMDEILNVDAQDISLDVIEIKSRVDRHCNFGSVRNEESPSSS